MKIEEVIEILEQRFDSSCRNNLFQNAEKLDYEDALWMAISALRSMQEAGEPFHIDRSKWEYCLTCRDLQYLPHEMCADVKMPGGSEIGASFCPSCGRPLTEEAWAELERRLRG